MFVALSFLYLLVGFIVATALLKGMDRVRSADAVDMVLAIATGVAWLPVAIAAAVLVAIDAALARARGL